MLLSACKSNKMIVSEQSIWLDTMNVHADERSIYRASRSRIIDILHMKLDLAFDWDSAFVIGKADLLITAFAKDIDAVELDAKGFQINKIGIWKEDTLIACAYDYDGMDIVIQLPEPLKPGDSLQLHIDYVAMPNKLKSRGSAAITDDKGLYFINQDGKTPNKPRQLWTQGETEANSAWFPTVDAPNERFTHEIYLHIEKGQTSISNGHFMFSVDNGDGTKTDYWKMDKPHSAYLVMLAVGEFAKVEDHWKDIEVNYYLDSAYREFAHDIFGNTPEMLSFFSDYLGVPYPWQKYDQVIVHDFVSGAMENTTATIHGEFLQQNRRELIDYNNEDVIAHELFHHWFGDLVTCESWSNLTLNEGFATYGEYLWNDYHLGRAEADLEFKKTLNNYLSESKYNNADLIRFYYEDKEDMFDSHSYAKGGRILHMLQNYLGEDIFRKGLNFYLTQHAYKSVEVHDLRIAFEHVSGEDLNWFFNQWFLASGHPILNINYNENTPGKLELIIHQSQDLNKYPLYYLPVDVEIVTELTSTRYDISVAHEVDTFYFDLDEKVKYLNFDPGKFLLGEINLTQSQQSWIALAREAELFIDRSEAYENLAGLQSEDLFKLHYDALTDSFRGIREFGLRYMTSYLQKEDNDSIIHDIIKIAEHDEQTSLRSMAIALLVRNFTDSSLIDLYLDGLNDSSYNVVATSFDALSEANESLALKQAKRFEASDDENIILTLAALYSKSGDASHSAFYENQFERAWGFGKYSFIMDYGNYLMNQHDSVIQKSFVYLDEVSTKENAWWNRLSGMGVVMELHAKVEVQIASYEKELKGMKMDDPNRKSKEMMLENSKNIFNGLEKIWYHINETETNPRLISVIDAYNKGVNILKED